MICIYNFQQLQHIDYTIVSPALTALCAIINIFVCCYFGKLTNESYKRMAECMNKINWYEFPVELQKYYILAIGKIQMRVYYHGFGTVNINFKLFTKVNI